LPRHHEDTDVAICLADLPAFDATGRGKTRWAMRCKPALNALAITFEGRIVPSATN